MPTPSKTPPPPTLWATVPEAAAHLGVATKTVRRMISRGEIEARRFGPRLIRVNLYQIDRIGTPLQYRDGA